MMVMHLECAELRDSAAGAVIRAGGNRTTLRSTEEQGLMAENAVTTRLTTYSI
jgi:hypothetical protein